MKPAITGTLILASILWPGFVQADSGSPEGCVVLGSEVYLAALRIEMQKSGLDLKWQAAQRIEDCHPGKPVLTFPSLHRAVLTLRSGATHNFRLESVEPQSRARTLARSVAQTLSESTIQESMPLIKSDDKLSIGKKSVSKPSEVADGYTWWARAGGVYLYQFGVGEHVAGVMIEPGISLCQGQLAFSLLGAFGRGSEYSADGSTGLSQQSTELIAMGRGGFKFDSLFLRGGLGIGWFRSVLIPSMEEDRIISSLNANNVGVVALDAELLWNVSSTWQLGALVSSRFYLGETVHLFESRIYYESFPAALGAQVTVGFSL